MSLSTKRSSTSEGGKNNNIRILTVDDVIKLSMFAMTSIWFLRSERRRRETQFLYPPSSPRRRSSANKQHQRRPSSMDQSQLSVKSMNNFSDGSGGSNNNGTGSASEGFANENDSFSKISSRGQAALSPPVPYLQCFARCLQEPCDPATNPYGYVGLCVAENKLVLDILAERLMQIGTATAGFSDSTVYCYNSFLGLPLPREAAAYFLAKRFLFPETHDNSRITPTNTTMQHTSDISHQNFLTPEQALHHIKSSHVALGAGCASLLSNLFFILGEHGDACLVPAPYYATYEIDMTLIADCHPVGFHMANVALGPTERDLDLGYVEARSKGLNPRFLLLTNPNNPLGVIYKPEVVRNAIQWARKRGIQTIVDEVHALSTHKKYDHGFESVIRVLNNELGDDVHMVYSLSKDFGASGLRVGILYSQNNALMEALSNLQMFGCVSGPIQYIVSELLTDDMFVDRFLDESRERIRWNYEICVQKLEEMVLPYVPAEAGLFVYVDFSSLLPEKTWEYEKKIFQLLFDYARVVLTPGETQCERTPGMFRICYAWVSPQVLQIAMERLSRLVAKIRRLNWDDFNPKTLGNILLVT